MPYYDLTYKLVDIKVDDDVVITPKQSREIGRKMQQAIDRSIEQILTGGHYAPPNDGRTIDHAPRRRRLEQP